MSSDMRGFIRDRTKTVRPHLHFGAADLAEEAALDTSQATSSLAVSHAPKRFDGADRLKTVLLIAAAFASVMVGVVATRSLLLGSEHPISNAQVGR
jgi:hypothetical protein